ncbi:hypothetical protein H4219_000004 [Mycoemilia scoparia]|uniref:FGGY carbohydrate kinase domain-containing protein n=1 Tax=Mycoemilia scoparia TaxID=417184 RepID=A0A9W8A9R8_9FUNG|nr:hypothetical protein H4219_000004 [Mycoemilia scoparia]
MSSEEYFIGIDIGSYSARAGLFATNGALLYSHKHPLKVHKPEKGHVEQSTEDIWASIVSCVRRCVDNAKESMPSFEPAQVKGIGFDATCSMAVVNRESGEPVSISLGGLDTPLPSSYRDGSQGPTWNVIMWMDHRAEKEAGLINSCKEAQDGPLRYVGGRVSLEMEIPKLVWLRNRFKQVGMENEVWRKAEFFDLPDFLTHRATESKSRSTCSLVCKWLLEPPNAKDSEEDVHPKFQGWDPIIFEKIGLGDIANDDFRQLGGNPQSNTLNLLNAGTPVPGGLSKKAASEMGLVEGTAVSAAVIDAYSGWLGTIAAPLNNSEDMEIDAVASRMAIIAGTSACHLLALKSPVFVPGVWGPYYSAGMDGWYMLEGGQSAVGSLIDSVVQSHSAYHTTLLPKAEKQNTNVYTILEEHLRQMATKMQYDRSQLSRLVADLHFLPDHHGNRSPLADPTLRGMFVGEYLPGMPDDLDYLALRYLSCLAGLAYGTKAIKDAIEEQSGQPITSILLSGGLCQNRLYVELTADIAQANVVIPAEIDGAVILGSAILGATAYKMQKSNCADSQNANQHLWECMKMMTATGSTVYPTHDKDMIDYHEKKYAVFKKMQRDQKSYQSIMSK